MDSIVKYLLLLFLISTIFSCGPRKCCPDLFGWKHGKPMPFDFKHPITLSEDNKIYALSGDFEGTFQIYDIQTKKWVSLPPLPVAVSFASGVILNHSIYIIGGIDSLFRNTKAFQRFDLKLNQWSTLPSPQFAVNNAVAVVCQEKIYVIGGNLSSDEPHLQISSLVEEYDPVHQTWTKKSDMPTSRDVASALVRNDQIIVAGGYTNTGMTDIVEKYDASADQWTRSADMPFPNAVFSMVEMQNTIYALGGKPNEGMSPILKYDEEADQWTQVSTVPFTRNRLGTVVVGDRVYIIGGEQNPQVIWIGKKV
ncbi:MAG: kelch repeat-containing protein [Saprospiraceae bacterium]